MNVGQTWRVTHNFQLLVRNGQAFVRDPFMTPWAIDHDIVHVREGDLLLVVGVTALGALRVLRLDDGLTFAAVNLQQRCELFV